MLTLTGGNTYSGSTIVHGGTLQVSAGQLLSPNQYVGYAAIGTFGQSSGVNNVKRRSLPRLQRGFQRQLQPQRQRSSLRVLSTWATPASARLTNPAGRIIPAFTTSSTSATTRVPTAATTSAAPECFLGIQYVGYSGTGTFNQSGGTNSFNIGSAFISATTRVPAAATTSAVRHCFPHDLRVCGLYSGSGTLSQSSGTNTLGSLRRLYLGYNWGSSGSYNLSGSGSLSAFFEYVGMVRERHVYSIRAGRITSAASASAASLPRQQLRFQRQLHPQRRGSTFRKCRVRGRLWHRHV